MASLLQDLKYSLRVQKKSIGVTIITVLTLGLSIGACTTVFSVVSTILLRPLPYQQSERIAMLWRGAPAFLGDEDVPWTARDFRTLQQTAKDFEQLGAFQSDVFNLTGFGEPVRVQGLRVSAGFFAVLGISPSLGRTFSNFEDQSGHEHEAILGDRLWREQFGQDSGIVGRSISLNGFSYSVVGVMPPSFAFPPAKEMPLGLNLPGDPELWVPIAISGRQSGISVLGVIGRLKPVVTMSQVQARMSSFEKALEADLPGEKGMLCRATPLEKQLIGDTRRPLLLLLSAVGLVLIVACSNVASLLLAKSLERRREFALRAALGGSRLRILRQLMTESILLATWGGLAGVLLAAGGVYSVKHFGPSNIPRLQEVGLDLRVLTFVIGVTFVTGILVGLTPALGALREHLPDQHRSGATPTDSKIRNALLVSQIALALALVIAGGLLVRTFVQLLKADPGFKPSRVLTFELSLPASQYKNVDEMTNLYHSVLQGLQGVAEVQSAGLVSNVPMGGIPDGTGIQIPDHPQVDPRAKLFANYSFASPGYFSAIGATLLRGRDFLEIDMADSTHVTIINNAMAKKFWPGEDPIGKQVGVPGPWPSRTIVGVIADVRHISVREEPGPEMYVPYTQNEIKVWPSMQAMQFALRTRSDTGQIEATVRAVVHSVDAGLPISKVATLATLVTDSMTQTRFSMLVLVSFGILALVLASVGMFAAISFSVTQRTREIGIRMAIGARRWDVFGMILGRGARLAGLGIVIGLITALSTTHLMASFLYGIRAIDPWTFAVVCVLWAGIALAACYLPAYRATKVDPTVALRHE